LAGTAFGAGTGTERTATEAGTAGCAAFLSALVSILISGFVAGFEAALEVGCDAAFDSPFGVAARIGPPGPTFGRRDGVRADATSRETADSVAFLVAVAFFGSLLWAAVEPETLRPLRRAGESFAIDRAG
jgi:hypothetical protein